MFPSIENNCYDFDVLLVSAKIFAIRFYLTGLKKQSSGIKLRKVCYEGKQKIAKNFIPLKLRKSDKFSLSIIVVESGEKNFKLLLEEKRSVVSDNLF